MFVISCFGSFHPHWLDGFLDYNNGEEESKFQTFIFLIKIQTFIFLIKGNQYLCSGKQSIPLSYKALGQLHLGVGWW